MIKEGKVTVLGTEYSIEIEEPTVNARTVQKNADALILCTDKRIILRDLHKDIEWKDESEYTIEQNMKKNLRHEIIHAFVEESGLDKDSYQLNIAWPDNEQITAYFAIQFPKILKAFEEVGAL